MARLDPDRPRPLRIVEELDGFACTLPDREATRQLQRRNLYFHVGMMALFITVVLAIPAWLAAGASILLSPQIASWCLRCTAHGLELSHLYTRTDPGVAELRGEVKSKGPGPIGFGKPEPPERLLFSEMEAVVWNDYALVFHLAGGERRELRLELTAREDIARLGQKIQEVFERYAAGQTVSREEAARERARLAALVQGRQRA